MEIRTLVVGPLQVNSYIVFDELSRDAVVIDPGDEPDRILDMIKELALSVRQIICTHGHFDHVGAVAEVQAETGGKLALHREEVATFRASAEMAALWGFEIPLLPEPDLLLSEGDTLRAGTLSLQVLHTPGHSPGGICLLLNGVLLSGDTLFAGSVGRTDFPGGDAGLLMSSFRRLMLLAEETRVLPGHGPETTIGRERKENLFADAL